jgi:hypothetical protein
MFQPGSNSGKDKVPTKGELLNWYYNPDSSNEMELVIGGKRYVLNRGQTEIINYEVVVGSLDSESNQITISFPKGNCPPDVEVEKREDVDNREL